MLKDFDAYRLAKEIYVACKPIRLPKSLLDQMARASASIALNIAEGAGKQTEKDQRRFYGIALGSLREVQAILDLEEIEDVTLANKLDRLGAILYTLTRPKRKPHRTGTETATPNRNGRPVI